MNKMQGPMLLQVVQCMSSNYFFTKLRAVRKRTVLFVTNLPHEHYKRKHPLTALVHFRWTCLNLGLIIHPYEKRSRELHLHPSRYTPSKYCSAFYDGHRVQTLSIFSN